MDSCKLKPDDRKNNKICTVALAEALLTKLCKNITQNNTLHTSFHSCCSDVQVIYSTVDLGKKTIAETKTICNQKHLNVYL